MNKLLLIVPLLLATSMPAQANQTSQVEVCSMLFAGIIDKQRAGQWFPTRYIGVDASNVWAYCQELRKF